MQNIEQKALTAISSPGRKPHRESVTIVFADAGGPDDSPFWNRVRLILKIALRGMKLRCTYNGPGPHDDRNIGNGTPNAPVGLESPGNGIAKPFTNGKIQRPPAGQKVS